MAKLSDLTGKKFGKLTVLSFAGLDNTKKNSKWNCKCDCGNETCVGRPCLIQGHTQSCGCIVSPPREEYDLSRERDFFKFVEKTETCWFWIGTTDKGGYGMFSFRTKDIKAHRYSFERFKGEKIKGGYMICHTCDNPSCVNPDHLYMGTAKDNGKDLADRKRWGPPRKWLDEKQKDACRILFSNGFSLREVGEVLNIDPTTVKKYAEVKDGQIG